MCNAAIVEFVARVLPEERVIGKRIIEVGSLDTGQGLPTVRGEMARLNPASYLGVDIVAGENVDEVCRAEDLCKRLGERVFDVLISTEVLEHVQDWRAVIDNFKRMVKPGGHLVITTRSHGFPLHAYPYDFWRWEIQDMRLVFGDCEIIALETDPVAPGVFLLARRPLDWEPLELSDIAIYSTVRFRRTMEIPEVVRPSGVEWLLRRSVYVYRSRGLLVFLLKSVAGVGRAIGRRWRMSAVVSALRRSRP
jgi:SAM-dependent methyltransferase